MTQFADDLVLIERAQKGDRDALDQLIRKYEKRAYQYAYRLTSNAEEASDVVGDAFVRIHAAMKNFKGNSAFTTWMYRILTNCFLDLRKRERSRPTQSLEATLQTEDGLVERQFESDEPTPDEVAERNQREATIERAVAVLPEYQRAMVTLYHAENLSYEEIAEALDLPIGTVKSRLNRARLSLREHLVKDEELFNLG
ncbi:MAG: sigma-70 family RNA polymerase sigma factor [Methanoregulaceae archaeon]|jgi:RNA polymerase sigma-70 factor (ECF subfamily)|nr:sigma-70 family RNA polymerase sigma factor [Methanoregulaceae archaeon]